MKKIKKILLLASSLIFSSLAFASDFFICVGSYKNPEIANARVSYLKDAGIKSFITEFKKDDGEKFYRVLLSESFPTFKDAKQKQYSLIPSSFEGLGDAWILLNNDENVTNKAQESLNAQDQVTPPTVIAPRARQKKVFELSINVDENGKVTYSRREMPLIPENAKPEKRNIVITDSDSGQPVANANVNIDKRWNVLTSDEGKAPLPDDITDGNHSIIVTKDGEYVPTNSTFVLENGEIVSAPQISIPKAVDYNRIKIILNWGETPYDLDSHIISSTDHVFFMRKRSGNLELDLDVTSSFGPETVTIRDINPNDTYQYYVFNYSDKYESESSTLSYSNARVKVYVDNEYKASFKVQPGQKGILWHVFDIVDGNVIVEKNEILNERM